MFQLISTTERIARKQHACDSCIWLSELDDLSGFTFADKRILVNLLRKRKGMIAPGDKYTECIGKYDGEIFRSRFIAEAHKLCRDYDVYIYD